MMASESESATWCISSLLVIIQLIFKKKWIRMYVAKQIFSSTLAEERVSLTYEISAALALPFWVLTH